MKKSEKNKRVKKGRWQNWDEVKKTIKALWVELGYFPATSDFKEHGYGGLLKALRDYYGGLKKVRKKLGGTPHLEKRRSKWADKTKVLEKVRQVRDKLGHFPTVTEIKEMGLSSLLNAVYRYHGGWESIRLALGEPKRYNRWNDLNEVLSYLKKLIEELGHFPSRQELTKRNNRSILHAIQSNHGGIYKIYQLLDIKPPRKPSGYWKNFDNVKNILQEIENDLGHFPTFDELRKLGHSGLASGISKHHGGYRQVKKILGIKPHQVIDGHWANFKKVENLINELKEKLQKFPTIIELEKYRPGIKFAIRKYHGGYNKVRKKLNVEIIQKRDGYWKDFQNIKNSLLELEEELGFFPTVELIYGHGPKGLADGIFLYHGGHMDSKY